MVYHRFLFSQHSTFRIGLLSSFATPRGASWAGWVCLTICPHEWNNARSTAQIFIKFETLWDIADLLKFSFISGTFNHDFTWRPMCISVRIWGHICQRKKCLEDVCRENWSTNYISDTPLPCITLFQIIKQIIGMSVFSDFYIQHPTITSIT
jgi:hypothetical protein